MSSSISNSLLLPDQSAVVEREMGDTSVDFFLETLKQLTTSSNLDFIIDDEKHQLQSLEEEIKYLRGFLVATEKKRNEHSEVMKLVMQIRDAVSEAENIVELFISHAFKADASPFQNNNRMINKKKIKKKSLPKNTTKNKASQEHREYLSLDLEGLLKTRVKKKKNEEAIREQQDHLSLDLESVQKEIKTLTGDDQVKKEKKKTIREHQDHLFLDLESIKKEIKTLTAEVKKIYDENMYDINGVAIKKLKHSSAGSEGGSNPSKVAEEKVVVGFKDEVETLMRKLDDSGESGVLEIISIVGAAGGGKTTLAREVYDQRLTSTTFEIRAWVVISQDYDKTIKRDLLMSILKSAFPENHEDYEKSNEDMLGEKLLKCLKGKKYLVVMDDIWGIEAWNDIQRSFPRDRKGSKVMLTS
ncbi:disease resistance protein RPP13-like isoform X2 [Rhododendron vialii]|uniref:disease resistance protein RPP13-like isoform X2 n=1 Tax=Rhododendron vialii TaxID=182163 RepID=UPI00265FA1AF|nr:disease resistance protein RPP13-like isoform X2 [Rhododendron vialii]